MKKKNKIQANNEKPFVGNRKNKHENSEDENAEFTDRSRRNFLKNIWKGLGVLAGLEIIGMISAFLFSGKNKNDRYKPVQLIEAGDVSSFKKGSISPFRGGRFYLARTMDGGFIALSLRCTHLGCSINWEANEDRFVCPCHSSAFDLKGNVINPPAPRALDYYPVIIEKGIVKVDVGTKKQRRRFLKEQLVYPNV